VGQVGQGVRVGGGVHAGRVGGGWYVGRGVLVGHVGHGVRVAGGWYVGRGVAVGHVGQGVRVGCGVHPGYMEGGWPRLIPSDAGIAAEAPIPPIMNAPNTITTASAKAFIKTTHCLWNLLLFSIYYPPICNVLKGAGLFRPSITYYFPQLHILQNIYANISEVIRANLLIASSRRHGQR
jgi:hypothetical protein